MAESPSTPTPDLRRRIPRTDRALADPRLVTAASQLGHQTVKQAVHEAQRQARHGKIAPEHVVDMAVAALPPAPVTLRAVINATGVVLHTNLGRAPLSPAAIGAITTAAGYVDVEYDLRTGTRAKRGRGALDALLTATPSAEDVHVVNNGAAALVLAATVLAPGREVVISRSELVEIGDGFRLHELLTSTGARLREVGTTNRTHLSDYADAIGPDTGFVLKVHPSNFRIEGFTTSVPVSRLASLDVPIVADIGSGLLRPDPMLPDEPDANSWLRQGATLVTASGDKLLGGPQAGLLLGRRDMVAALRRHPLARALRVDKLTLAALEATLRGPTTPTSAAVHADPTALRARAVALAGVLTGDGVAADAVPSDGAVGGGAAPGKPMPGWAVRLSHRFADLLRRGTPAIVGRVDKGYCLLDLRCVPATDDAVLRAAVRAAAQAIPDRADDACTS